MKKYLKDHKFQFVGPIVVIAIFTIIKSSGLLYVVSGTSMYPTLNNSDIVLCSSLRTGEVRRGDVVVARTVWEEVPWLRKSIVKRVIGIPGDTISIRAGGVYVNGTLCDKYGVGLTLPDVEEFVLGPDQYYLLGDNRENSKDSRQIGPVDRADIVSKCKRAFNLFK